MSFILMSVVLIMLIINIGMSVLSENIYTLVGSGFFALIIQNCLLKDMK